jgi:hypothetical protein
MIFDISIDDVDTILAIRTSILQGNFVESGGLTITSWSSEGTTVTKQWAISPQKLLEETKLYLQKYDPSLYGHTIKRTTPRYLS